jgi:Galactose-binding domain-like
MPRTAILSHAVAALALTAASFGVAAADLAPLQVYGAEGTVAPNQFFLGTPANWAAAVPKNGRGAANAGSINAEPAKVDGKDGIKITWTGGIGQVYSQSKTAADQLDYLDANGALVFDAIVHTAPEDQVTMRVDCRYPCMGVVDTTEMYRQAPLNQPMVVKIPLGCFEATGTKFTAVNTPFLIFTAKKFSLSMANIRWVPGAGKDADALKCPGA